MRAPLLLALLSWLAPASADVWDTLALGGSLAPCKLTFPKTGWTYDLCPLFGTQARIAGGASWEERTPPTIMHTTVRWSFGGPLSRAQNGTEHCPRGTWICKTVSNRRIADHDTISPRITQLVPIAGKLLASEKHHEHSGHEDEDVITNSTDVDILATVENYNTPMFDDLLIRIHGGMFVQKPQHAVFAFRCDKNVGEPTAPVYHFDWSGAHWFAWTTRHACALSGSATMPNDGTKKGGAGADRPASGERPPSDERPPVDDDVERPHAAVGRVWKRTVWILVTLAALGLVIALYTNRVPGAKLAYTTTCAILAPLYHRPSTQLVRWARQRAGYESVELEGEAEGTPVDEDEGSVGPRKTALKSYGTR